MTGHPVPREIPPRPNHSYLEFAAPKRLQPIAPPCRHRWRRPKQPPQAQPPQTHGDTRATPNDLLGMSCVHHGKPTTWWLAGCTRGRHMSGEVVAPFFERTSALPTIGNENCGELTAGHSPCQCATPCPLSPLAIRCVAGYGVVCQAAGVRRADGCEAERGGCWCLPMLGRPPTMTPPPSQAKATTSSTASTDPRGHPRDSQ